MGVKESQPFDISFGRPLRQKLSSLAGDGAQDGVDEADRRPFPGGTDQLHRAVDGGEIGNAIEEEQPVGAYPRRRADFRVHVGRRAVGDE